MALSKKLKDLSCKPVRSKTYTPVTKIENDINAEGKCNDTFMIERCQDTTSVLKLPSLEDGRFTEESSTSHLSDCSRLTYVLGRKLLSKNLNIKRVLNNRKVEKLQAQMKLIASAVAIWHQKLENKRSVVTTPSRSIDTIGTGSKSDEWTYTRGESPLPFIFHGIELICRQVINITSGSWLSWSFSNLERKLLHALQAGSVALLPVIENLLQTMWNFLKDFWEIQESDLEQPYSILDVVKNAFQVIRSLIHLGYAWRNSCGFSDPAYAIHEDRAKNVDEKVYLSD